MSYDIYPFPPSGRPEEPETTPGMTGRAAQSARQRLAESEQVDYASATIADLCCVIGSLQATVQLLLLAIDTDNGDDR
ncbi:hypothetical protein ACFWIB_10375 [Streptomyces sp. NPDC127051]|uniref:hypothetical protein n=1 Tax=Streptomyces sp. NPDC127051 TaxID=3347119 RepID=UPI00364FD7A1